MMLSRCFRQGRLLAALFVWVFSQAAQAHGARHDIRVDISPVNVPGLAIELHQDFFSPQLVVSNRSGKMLEILDADGRSFLRIGPHQAEADLASKAYHLTRISGGGDAHANTLSKTPHWRPIAKEPAYGWFDTRIATVTLDIPYAVKQIGAEMPFGEWRIPARLGGAPFELRGVFSYTPPPAGVAIAALQSPSLVAKGVSVQLVPGPVPVIFLRNSSQQTVAVLDDAGKAFLKIGPDGTWADASNPAWRAASPVPLAPGKAGWTKLSKATSVSWLEARAAWRGKLPKPLPASGQLNSWQVPLQVGSATVLLRGINRWIARPAASGKLATSTPPSR